MGTRPGPPARPLRLALAACLLLGPMAGCNWSVPTEPWEPAPGPATRSPIAPREACLRRDPERRAFFGDLHVHTAFSMDARAMGTTTSPDDAYRFARGEPTQVYGGTPEAETRTVRLSRPLDFAAVTDHAEWMGEVALCTTPGSPSYASDGCQIYRGERRAWLARLLGLGGFMANMAGIVSPGGRPEGVCGEGGAICRAALIGAWQATQAAAERWYDRTSDCSFTTFHAWEYSRSPQASKVHRNVILRNELSPELPISSVDTPHSSQLREKLVALCNGTDTGCEAIAIPHNPNLSNGQSFALWYTDLPLEEQRREAALRAELEPIVEMMQIKGESECRNGMFEVLGEPDELCDFEKIRDMGQDPADCEEGAGSGAQRGRGCTSRLDFVRYALLEGVREQRRIGVNPYPVGFIGSTDTHNATPGATEERIPEKFGVTTERLLTIGEARRAPAFWNPGGLAGIYAEENTRDALFDAMKRRETFATSGTRIVPRFFGGFELPADWCESAERNRLGDARGVPMGGSLGPAPSQGGPTFGVSALRDPGTASQAGGLLQRLQIVKGWVDDRGRFHQQVHEVAGGVDEASSVDPTTCEPTGPGHDALCGTWTDPAFDPGRQAVYYARVVENPSCRWSTRVCNALAPGERPDGCDRLPKTIQERAWTSPIWFTPGDASPRTP